MISVSDDAIAFDQDDSPEVRIWAMVIEQAVRYAHGEVPFVSVFNRRGRSENFVSEKVSDARRWLAERDGQLEEICELLGIDADAVRRLAQTKLTPKAESRPRR